MDSINENINTHLLSYCLKYIIKIKISEGERKRERKIHSHVHVEKSNLVSHGESNWDGSLVSTSNPIKHIIRLPCSSSLFHSKVIPFTSHNGTFVFFISGFVIFVQIHIKTQILGLVCVNSSIFLTPSNQFL